ncbi:MAG: right-handed parallel beta-helix repeat-containing protein [Elusimicrobia bacterium]|nr:right-handed parallel beta-helix repeat-containing protein [Elusimicrobiota bacterium]
MPRYLILVISFFGAADSIAKTVPSSPQSTMSSIGVPVSTKNPEAGLAVKEYQEYLSGLDKSSSESMFSAKNYFRDRFSGKDEEISEAALRLFMDYYSQVIASAQVLFDSKPEYEKVLGRVSRNYCNEPANFKSHGLAGDTSQSKAALEQMCKFINSGIRFADEEEGTVVRLKKDPAFVVDVASRVPGAYASFLRMYYPDAELPWANDGGLGLTWGQLGERISRWEKFSQRYSALPETAEIINPALVDYISVFTGESRLPNTPVFGRNGGIDPGLKKAYESFLENHKDSGYFHRVKDAFDTFKAQEPPRDPAFDALQLKITSAKENDVIEIPPGQYNVDLGNGLVIRDKKGLKIIGKNGGVRLISNSPDLEIVKITNSTGIVLDGLMIFHTVPVGCSAACISIMRSESITIQNSDIHGSGAFGIAAWGWDNKDIRVLSNKIHNCSSSGVEIHSAGGEISHNSFYDNNRDIDIGKPPRQSKDMEISDNTFSGKK